MHCFTVVKCMYVPFILVTSWLLTCLVHRMFRSLRENNKIQYMHVLYNGIEYQVSRWYLWVFCHNKQGSCRFDSVSIPNRRSWYNLFILKVNYCLLLLFMSGLWEMSCVPWFLQVWIRRCALRTKASGSLYCFSGSNSNKCLDVCMDDIC